MKNDTTLRHTYNFMNHDIQTFITVAILPVLTAIGGVITVFFNSKSNDLQKRITHLELMVDQLSKGNELLRYENTRLITAVKEKEEYINKLESELDTIRTEFLDLQTKFRHMEEKINTINNQ